MLEIRIEPAAYAPWVEIAKGDSLTDALSRSIESHAHEAAIREIRRLIARGVRLENERDS
jgi:hypothetical protein